MAQLEFNAHEVAPSVAFEPIPAGKYLCEITESEIKPTKSGDGSYLKLTFTVLDGQYKNRRVFDQLCINHSNSLTVKIARANLSAICHAVGVMHPQDTVQLHNLPLVITVKCTKNEGSNDIYNEIKGYAKRESAPPVSQPQQAATDDDTPPWARG